MSSEKNIPGTPNNKINMSITSPKTPNNTQFGTMVTSPRTSSELQRQQSGVIKTNPSFINGKTVPSQNGQALDRNESFSEELLKKTLSFVTGKEIVSPQKSKSKEMEDELKFHKDKVELLLNEFQLLRKETDSKIHKLEEQKKNCEAEIVNLNTNLKKTIDSKDTEYQKLKTESESEIKRLEAKYDNLSKTYVEFRKTTAQKIENLELEIKNLTKRAEESEQLRLQNIEDEKKERERIQNEHDVEKTGYLDQISKLTEERNNLEAQVKDLTFKIENLSQNYKDFQNTMEEKVKNLTHELEESQKDNQRLNGVINERDGKIRELNDIITTRNNHISDLDAKIKKNLEDLNEADFRIRVLEKEKADALKLADDNDKLYKQNVEFEKLVRERLIKGHEVERITLHKEIEELKTDKKNLEENLNNTIETLRNLQKEYEDAKQRNEREQNSLKSELSRVKDEKDKNETSFKDLENQLHKEIDKLENEIKETIQRYETQYQKVSKEYREYKEKTVQQITDLQKDNHDLKEENIDIKEKWENISAQNTTMNIEIQKIKKENEFLQKTKESLSQNLSTLEEEEKKLHHNYEETKSNLEQTVLQLRNSENEITRLKNQNQELFEGEKKGKKALNEAQSELSFHQEKLEKLEKEKKELSKQYESLQMIYSKLEEENSKLKSQFSQLEIELKTTQDIAKNNGNVDDVLNQVEKTKSELVKIHNSEVQKLKQTIIDLNKEIDDNDKELDELNEKLLLIAKQKKSVEDSLQDYKNFNERKIQELNAEKQKLLNDIAIISSEKKLIEVKTKLEEEIASLTSKLKETQKEKEDYQKKESEAQDLLKRYQDEKEKNAKFMDDERKDLNNQINLLRDEKKKLFEKELELEGELTKLKKTLNELKSTNEGLQRDILQLTNEKEKLGKIKENGVDSESTKIQISKLNEKIQSLQKDQTKYAEAYFFEKKLKEEALKVVKKYDPKNDLLQNSTSPTQIVPRKSLEQDRVDVERLTTLENQNRTLTNHYQSLTEEFNQKKQELETLKNELETTQLDLKFFKQQNEEKDKILTLSGTEREQLIESSFREKEKHLSFKIADFEKQLEQYNEEKKKNLLLTAHTYDLTQYNIERFVLDHSILFFNEPDYTLKIPSTVKTIYLCLQNFNSFDSKKNQTFANNVIQSFKYIINEHYGNIKMMIYWFNVLFRLTHLIKYDHPTMKKIVQSESLKEYDIKQFKVEKIFPNFLIGRTNKIIPEDEVISKFGAELVQVMIQSYMYLLLNIYENFEKILQSNIIDIKKISLKSVDQSSLNHLNSFLEILDNYYHEFESQKIEDVFLHHFFKSLGALIDNSFFNSLLNNKVNSSKGLQMKMNLSMVENWFETKNLDVHFMLSREASDILMIDDKKKLIDPKVRREICPKLTPAQITTIFKNYTPDDLDKTNHFTPNVLKEIGTTTDGKGIHQKTNVILSRRIINEDEKGVIFNLEISQSKNTLWNVKISNQLSSKKELQFLNSK